MSTRLARLAVPVLIFVAACGTEPATPAQPTSTTPSALDVPAIDVPLTPGRFAEDPCALLGESERATLELLVARKSDEVSGPTCDLSAEGGASGEFLQVKFTSGLARVAAQCGTSASAQCDAWTVAMIDGYPAIRANGDLESRYGSCKLLLGISDDMSVMLADIRTTPAAASDCGRAERAAAMVLAALRE